MTERDDIAWMYRRAGFGPAVGQLDDLSGQGLAVTLDRFVDPGAHGVAPAPDPWAGLTFGDYDPKNQARDIPLVIGTWLTAMIVSPRPFEEWMRWFWHGHFVSTIRVVKYPRLMIDQLQLFGEFGLGDFRSLLRAVTIDAAMLLYLDGAFNKISEVNENYGREVLELFALGVGNYTEADVRAGSEALTGYYTDRRASGSRPPVGFDPRRHDDAPKDYLGRTGVHDLDSVVDAIVGHPACAPFITRKLATAILGPGVSDALVQSMARDFAATGLQIRPLARAIIEAGLAGASNESIIAPVPWLVAMFKATGIPPAKNAVMIGARGLPAAGQVPLDAPNVAGWPGGHAWLASSTTVARFNMAGALAATSRPDNPVRLVAAGDDVAGLADRLGRPSGFGPGTVAALSSARAADPTGVVPLALAMASPEVATC